MRNPSTIIGIAVVAFIAVGLLVWQRIADAPERETLTLVNTYCTADMGEDTCWGSYGEPANAYELHTFSSIFREYAVGATRVLLDHDTLLTLNDASMRFDAGRVVVDGSATLTVRDVAVTTDGSATLVHYSWLNTLDLMVIDGSADVRQGGYTSTVTAGNAVRIDTLPPYDAVAPTTFNLDAASTDAFYDWALGD